MGLKGGCGDKGDRVFLIDMPFRCEHLPVNQSLEWIARFVSRTRANVCIVFHYSCKSSIKHMSFSLSKEYYSRRVICLERHANCLML